MHKWAGNEEAAKEGRAYTPVAEGRPERASSVSLLEPERLTDLVLSSTSHQAVLLR